MATIDAHGYDFTIPQETVRCSPPKEGEILVVWILPWEEAGGRFIHIGVGVLGCSF